MNCFIDTNIFLRFFVKENKKMFQDCRDFLQVISLNKFNVFTSSLVLSEVVWVLGSHYKFSKKKIVLAIKSILNLRRLEIVDGFDYDWGLKRFEDLNVKYIDALIASIGGNKNKKWTVVSYDKDFDKLGILRKEPRQILTDLD